ncbi:MULTISPECIES: FKBP-type peptidyl-prolyl cis-trans isomerase [Alteromonadaceae]|uniref:FKBP-type peptidyl-prolyl cis-trans isomerase n=1 Tax=Alteromonadaceae TaxID=72275 RepID=UPI001C09D627|nr:MULTISPECIES: FKBP-type peptidyl-prolyl cis-trans isomerase [Aliiglaciecola]MBU2877510.1 FKBP-type peptidyl-prolyl cis-trans isomerase [Aliiglaciecola lipolytica]MDO6711090.1 FKBP-type peptidyl-prolyl cis-trans isomerase [Aliiglaciecola sp. 2_MG-2023]MDO6752004.1 FKBP-type peptidyl-prolyl cis-trans isomerase [Aliiglaciecola sp. 1_MG-2023]
MKKAAIAFVVASVFGITACQQKADPLQIEEVKFTSAEEEQAYAFGASVGGFVEQRLAAQESMGVELDRALILKGFAAAMQAQSQLEQGEIQKLNADIDKAMQAGQLLLAEKNIEKGKQWLAENAKKENVTETESGLQYEVLISSEGDSPSAEDTVQVHYRGTLLDGTEFDSSYSRGEPATFPLNRVISGWTEGVQLMTVGSKYKFYIPSELAYGERATGKITPNSTLIFEVELLDILNKEAVE